MNQPIRQTDKGTMSVDIPQDVTNLEIAIKVLENAVEEDRHKGDEQSLLFHDGALREYRKKYAALKAGTV